MSALVLALSPSATATAMALFRGAELLRGQQAQHREAELNGRRVDQRGLRARAVRSFLESSGVVRGGLAAVVGRGGALRVTEPGTYGISDALLRDAEHAAPDHPANLGASVAHAIAAEWGCPAFVVDPDSLDEREILARLAGTPAPARAPALAMRAAVRRHAAAVGRPAEALRLVVAHVAARVSLCACRANRMIDVVELFGDEQAALRDPEPARARGPFTPPPIAAGATDLPAALARAERGDSGAILALQAAAYRVAKAVGELATVLEGDVDAVLLTGNLAGAGPIVAELCRRVEWIAPVFLYREEDELSVLADRALRVLSGEEPVKRYG